MMIRNYTAWVVLGSFLRPHRCIPANGKETSHASMEAEPWMRERRQCLVSRLHCLRVVARELRRSSSDHNGYRTERKPYSCEPWTKTSPNPWWSRQGKSRLCPVPTGVAEDAETIPMLLESIVLVRNRRSLERVLAHQERCSRVLIVGCAYQIQTVSQSVAETFAGCAE